MNKKVLALFLCCALVFGMVPAALSTAFSSSSDFTIYGSNGTPTDSITLPQNDKTTLTAVAETGSGYYQWQIRVSDSVWANIVGSTGTSLELSYAMVANLLSGDRVDIRCRLTNDVNNVTYSNIVAVTVEAQPLRVSAKRAPTAGRVLSGAEPIGEPIISGAPDSVQSSPDGTPAADDTGSSNEETPSTYSIVINYQFEDGTQVANPWTATIAAGSSIQQTIISPVVVGYTPDQESVDVNVTNADKDTTYNVIYRPALVSYTVNHWQQNVDNDDYVQVDTETKTGLTKTAVSGELAKTYEGFYSLLYDTTTEIAADGSTSIDVYYDRYYYLMSFDLDGGYGVEPIYARYGAPISVGTPTKPGYTFTGWDKEIPTTMPAMPAENEPYRAQWQAGDGAKVTIVVWGENADDEGYSFYHNSEIMAKPGDTLTLNDLQGKLICGKEEHTHSASCGINCTHTTHGLACYGLSANAQPVTPDSEALKYFAQLSGGVQDGYIYYFDDNGYNGAGNIYYLRLNGNYYKYDGRPSSNIENQVGTRVSCDEGWGHSTDYFYKYNVKVTCTHTHDDSCYACGKPEHTHTSACYYNNSFMENPNLWKLVRSDEVTVAADGTTIINVYYDRVEFTLTFRVNSNTVATIHEKWGAEISDEFQKAPFNTTYNGRAWKCTDSSQYDYALQTLDRMPGFDATFDLYTKSSDTKKTIYYYVQRVGTTVSADQWPSNANNFDLLKQVDTLFNYATYEEEYHEIQGFTRYSASVAGFNNDNRKNFSSNKLDLYYMRNSYTLKFYNHNGYVSNADKTVQYEASLAAYNFEPDYPAGLEPNAYVFAGWYTTAGCYEGSEADLNTMTMPASDVILYAKWTPKTHTVRTYLTKDAMDNGEAELNTWNDVPHGTTVEKPENPENGKYTFVGWFYISDTGEEKAFDFSMPVNRDLDLYAKWSSNTLMEYIIRYQLEGGTEIAEPTKGSALACTTKTFDAKTGTQLDAGYQSGYFPKTASHSLFIDIEGTAENKLNEYTFIYVPKEEVNYTVRYLEKDTNVVLHEEKQAATRDAVITEKFVQIGGYAPDAYQKRLVLSADEENNVITFWYVKDEAHAPVQIIHWRQNIAGDGYTEYRSSTNLNGVIDQVYSGNPLVIPGFVYNEEKSNARGTLTAEGLVLNLYYDRIEYPYEFRFLEQGTKTTLADPITGKARYQAQVTQTAKTIPGYRLVSAENQAISISIEDPENIAKKNIKTFLYVEDTVDIKYEVVGPTTGSGTLDNYQDNGIGVINGTVEGSTPTAASGFKFVGWFKNPECTESVDATWVDASNKLTPGKTKNYGTEAVPVMGYEAATYYAKFEYDVADLTIQKTGCQDIDEYQSFLFDVTGPDGYSKRVAIKGNGSVTITGLKIGEYTVTEVKNWSWRYEPKDDSQSIILQPVLTNAVTFDNSRSNQKWLGGDAYEKNVFGGTN